MNKSNSGRSDILKYLILLLVFGSLMVIAAFLRPWILSKTAKPEPTVVAVLTGSPALKLVTITRQTALPPSATFTPTATATNAPTATATSRMKATPTSTATPEPAPTEKVEPTEGPTATASQQPSPTPEPATPAPGPTPQTYTVQAKDNLFRIGLKYNLTVDTLMAMNNLTNPDMVLVGQVLIVGYPAIEIQTGQKTYQVKWGDTLWKISRAYGVPVEQIAAANGITDPNAIKAGTVLSIP